MYVNKQLRKALLGVSATGVLAVASTDAMAVVFPDFTVTTDAYGTDLTFQADKIVGNYVEVVTFNGDGTFDVSIKYEAGQFVANDGTTALNAATTGLGSQYGLYALFQGSGTFSSVGTTTNFTLVSGSLSAYIDDLLNTILTAPASGAAPWTVANNADDDLIATGSLVEGSGTLNTSCPPSTINCGSFGQTTTFNLTAAGSSFFTSPIPFFNLSLQSGQFNNFEPVGTQTINGSMDTVFAAVPEPASLGLLGMGLLAMGFSLRKKRS